MKTIIIRTNENEERTKVNTFISKLERYTDNLIKDAVICTRYLGPDNYNTILGELKDATAINDYDLFIIAVMHPYIDIASIQAVNKAHTLTVMDDEYDSAKNYMVMI